MIWDLGFADTWFHTHNMKINPRVSMLGEEGFDNQKKESFDEMQEWISM